MSPRTAGSWAVLGRSPRLRWGGDLRRAYVFDALARRTEAVVEPRWNAGSTLRAIARAEVRPAGRRRRARLATAELLGPPALRVAVRLARPVVLDLHDEPVIQAAALGRPLDPIRARAVSATVWHNISAFECLVVPSAPFAELVGLDPSVVIVAPNGTDASHVRPGLWPDRPTIGLVSAAAPNRGIELLVAAAKMLRSVVPDLRLRLWLAGTDRAGTDYIEELRTSLLATSWAEVRTSPYAELGETLSEATVLVVPHPPNSYLDVAVPVKLADSMAAGRPVVVTPRLETARIVRETGSGVVTRDDTVEALADAIGPLLADAALAAELGARARRAAETEFDWHVIGGHVADAVLGRLERPAGFDQAAALAGTDQAPETA